MKRILVAICVPSHGDPKLGYAMSLASLCAHSAGASLTYHGEPARIGFAIISSQSSVLAENRCSLVDQALRLKPDFVLFTDTDHIFPHDALIRLLALDLDVVGVNQPQRTSPTGPMATRLDDDGKPVPVYTTEEMAKERLVEEVAATGMSFTLVRASVLKGLKQPLFMFTRTSSGMLDGEDTYFYRKLREAGHAVHIDHALSWEMGHIYERPLKLSDTLAQREAFERRPKGLAFTESPPAGGGTVVSKRL